MLGVHATMRASTSSTTPNVIHCITVVKKKLEAYIPDVIVLKNQVPSHYRKLHSKFYDDNKYYNEQTDELVQFPKSGGFEVYFDGILVFSKIQSNLWPCHNRIIDLVQTMIEEKREGGQVEKYSLENRIFNDSDELFRQTYNKVIQREFKAQEVYLKGIGSGLAKSNVVNYDNPLGSPIKAGLRVRKQISGTSGKKNKELLSTSQHDPNHQLSFSQKKKANIYEQSPVNPKPRLQIRPFSRGNRAPLEREEDPMVDYLKDLKEEGVPTEGRKAKLQPIRDVIRKNSQKRLEEAMQRDNQNSLEGEAKFQAPVIVSGRVFRKASEKDEQDRLQKEKELRDKLEKQKALDQEKEQFENVRRKMEKEKKDK